MTMDWVQDVGLSRAGDRQALSRLLEYLAPFIHGVALAHAPHHVVDASMPRLLEAAVAVVGTGDEVGVVEAAARSARQLSRELARAALPVAAPPSEAHRALERLRVSAEPERELVMLRLVEGISGRELAEALRLEPAVVRQALEAGLAEVARLFGLQADFAGDRWLWEFSGTPGTFLARLELLLPELRHEVGISAPLTSERTFIDLLPVTAPVMRPDPFVGASPTLPATGLPAEARGSVGAARPAHPGGPRASPPGPADGAGRGIPPLPSLVSPDGTLTPAEAERLRARLAALQASETDPDRTQAQPILGGPPAMAPTPPPSPSPGGVSRRTAKKVRGGGGHDVERRGLQRAGAQSDRTIAEPLDDPDRTATRPFVDRGPREVQTRVGLAPPRLASLLVSLLTVRGWLGRGAPVLLALALISVGFVVGWRVLRTPASDDRAWPLVAGVVAEEDLEEGAVLTSRSVDARAVPRPERGGPTELVLAGDLRGVLGQRLGASLLKGDPLFVTQLASKRLERGLPERVVRLGRAVSFAIPVDTMASELVRPGDRVDVVAQLPRPTARPPSARPGATAGNSTKMPKLEGTLLRDVPLLSLGHIATYPGDQARGEAWTEATLLLHGEEAQRLALASSLGRLRLTARAVADRGTQARATEVPPELAALLSGERRRGLQARRDAAIELIRGEVFRAGQAR